jgi:hypothetical protein
MALRESRRVEATTIEYVVTAAAERGGVLSAASGNVASYNTSITPSSIVPIGILLEDIESQNYMTHPQYYQRNVSDLGSQVGIMTKGECVTDMIDPYAENHISAGKRAYLTHSGLLTTWDYAPGVVGANADIGHSGVLVGHFMSNRDSNGFARVRIDL